MERAAEKELIRLCRRGDESAWQELFQHHYAPAGRFIHQVSPDFTREDTDEVCQEVFLSVVKHLDAFNQQSRLQSWIFRIAANKARDYRAKQYAAKRGGGQVVLSLHAENDQGEVMLDPASPLPAPDEEMLRAENWKHVGQALEKLGGPCQEILELRYFADLDYDEISQTLDLNEKTVSSRLSKCKDKLEGVLRRIIARGNSDATPSKR